MDLTLEFDEKNILELNMEYLLQTLEVSYHSKKHSTVA